MKKFIFFIIIFIFFYNISELTSYSEVIRFAQISDVHFSNLGNSYNSSTFNNRHVKDTKKLLTLAIQDINNKKNLDFVIFLGDNIDKSNKEDLIGFLNIANQLKVPYYLVLGNHDVHKISGITKTEYMQIVKHYNKSQKKLNSYYSFKIKNGARAVILDGAMPYMPNLHGKYTLDQLDFLEKFLTKFKKDRFIIFQHFPLIPPKNNLVSHTLYEPHIYSNLIEKYKNNIVSINSGHYHYEDIETDKNGIIHIVVPGLLQQPHLYQIVEIDYDNILNKKDKTFVNKPKVRINSIRLE